MASPTRADFEILERWPVNHGGHRKLEGRRVKLTMPSTFVQDDPIPASALGLKTIEDVSAANSDDANIFPILLVESTGAGYTECQIVKYNAVPAIKYEGVENTDTPLYFTVYGEV